MKLKYLLILLAFLNISFAYSQDVNINVIGNTCVNSELSFIAESSITLNSWNWTFGDGNTSNQEQPQNQYSDSGWYSVTLTTTINSISRTFSKNIYISENPKADFIADSTVIWFSSYSRVFFDRSESYTPISMYTWNFGDNSNRLTTTTDSTYYKYNNDDIYEVWLKVTDTYGCVDSVSKPIAIHNRFFVPNVFTPNNDQTNDEFIVTSNGITLFSIEIYSRWGNIVFKRDGHEQIIWDGRMPDGTLVKPGTYYYVINAEEGNVTYDPEKGFITVFY